MAEASIPVDLFNPGQVFACLGFLEVADLLLGDAEGGFDWSDKIFARFRLQAQGDENPFAVVLRFLAEAKVRRIAPCGYTEPPKKKQEVSKEEEDNDEPEQNETLRLSDVYPARESDRLTLPIRLQAKGLPVLDVSHWADGSSRDDFKLYSGNRSAFGIARAMLSGTRSKPKKNLAEGELETHGLSTLWAEQKLELIERPFDVLTSVGGSFNFDPRGAWTALDAGYSPNQHSNHGVTASPVVEILAAIAMEHSRPDEYEKRKVRYAAWGILLPPMLARPVIAGTPLAVPVRSFRFDLALSGKNKVVTFAHEESGT
jgi:CRISPR-associated protein Csx14